MIKEEGEEVIDGKPSTLDYSTKPDATDPGFKEALIVVSVLVASVLCIVLFAALTLGHPWRSLLSD